jgi:hypothetical protein
MFGSIWQIVAGLGDTKVITVINVEEAGYRLPITIAPINISMGLKQVSQHVIILLL